MNSYRLSGPRQLGLALWSGLLVSACEVGDSTQPAGVIEEDEAYAAGSPVFYDDVGFNGASFSVTNTIGFVGWEWNDRVSSVIVPDGMRVVLHEHADFGGRGVTIEAPGASDLRDLGFNDSLSSIEVSDAPGGGGGGTQPGTYLASGQALFPDQYIENSNGRLVYQSDGNLVLTNRYGQVRFATYTVGVAPGVVVMQPDGNLVLYDAGGRAVLSSGTDGNHGAWATISYGCIRDGWLVICSDDNRNDTFLTVRGGDPATCSLSRPCPQLAVFPAEETTNRTLAR